MGLNPCLPHLWATECKGAPPPPRLFRRAPKYPCESILNFWGAGEGRGKRGVLKFLSKFVSNSQIVLVDPIVHSSKKCSIWLKKICPAVFEMHLFFSFTDEKF